MGDERPRCCQAAYPAPRCDKHEIERLQKQVETLRAAWFEDGRRMGRIWWEAYRLGQKATPAAEATEA